MIIKRKKLGTMGAALMRESVVRLDCAFVKTRLKAKPSMMPNATL